METSISLFDIKIGFPPKPLSLDRFDKATKLQNLDVRLNGEQLIVSDRASSSSHPHPPAAATSSTSVKSQAANKFPAPTSDLGSEIPSSFSFGDLGQAPPKAPLVPTGSQSSSKAPSSAPLALNRKDHSEVMNDPPEVVLPELGGTLVLRIMPDDNSCLFRAISFSLLPAMDTMNELRSVVAQAIQADPERYTKAVLDNKDPDTYCRWIQTEDAWGGQIELDIFSRHFDVEICSIDVQTLRVDRYNEGAKSRCIVVYSGIHYDAIALSPFDSPPEFDIKVFDSEPKVLEQAVILCQILQQKHYFTDTSGFKIRCNDCGATVTGERGATEHATKTGHYNFGEAQ
ncbi:MAG: hypothetical protein Q9227_001938 [Pyrenula ochraceoflavens]